MSKKKTSKAVILGDSGVGKTSLLNSYIDQKFMPSYKATVGADFLEKQIFVDGKAINLQIWDTAGQQKFRSLGSAFFRGANICVLVYDVTNQKSFDNIQTWIKYFLDQGSPKQPENFPFILIGNKTDKQSQREVCENILSQFMIKYPKIKHFAVSAKDRSGVEQAFENIALVSIENMKQQIFIPAPLIKGIPQKVFLRQKKKATKCC